jgi:hypothetical protein
MTKTREGRIGRMPWSFGVGHPGLDVPLSCRRAHAISPLGWGKSAAGASCAGEGRVKTAVKFQRARIIRKPPREAGTPAGSKNISKVKDASNPSQDTSKPQEQDGRK